MAVFRLQVTDGTTFLIQPLQRNVLDLTEISAMAATKLRSLLVFCPICPEGQHPKETICYSPQVVDRTTLAIMVQLLEERSVLHSVFRFRNVCAVAQYLILTKHYLMPYLLPYLVDEATLGDAQTLQCIERLYIGGY